MTLRIAMWSGPRNLSTAMMRSFGSRSDTYVSDEPFYGAFLKETGADHPMRDEVIASMDTDWRSVMASLRGNAPDGSPVSYQKHMWHHMAGPIGYDDFAGFTHAFLIREPERMIASYLRKREAGITAIEKDFSLTDVYGADEAFVTGTFAGIVPVREVDGRRLTCRGPMVERLQKLYADRIERDVSEADRA